MVYTGYSGGESTQVGIAQSWAPGDSSDPNAWATPTEFLMVESDGLQSKPNHVERQVMGAGRDADLGHRTGKAKHGGSLTLGLFPQNGRQLLTGALGNETALSAVVAVTSTAVASANNRTTFTVADSSTLTVGRPALIDTGAAQELLPLIEKTATTLVFPQCQIVHSSTTSVSQPAATLISPYSKASGYGNQLRRYAVEDSPGLKYAQRYAGGMVGKWALKAGASKFEVSADLMFSAPRVRNTTPTDLDETVGGWGELGFEFTDGALVFPADPGSTGSTVLQLVQDGQDWDLSIDNKLREIACFDGTDSYKYFPGIREVQASYQILNQANYPVAYEQFVLKNINVPWFSYAAINTGTSVAKKFQAMVFHMPNARFLDSEEVKGINDEIGEKVTVRALKAANQEKLYVYRVITP